MHADFKQTSGPFESLGRVRRCVGWVASLAVAALLAGCGGSSGGTPGTSTIGGAVDGLGPGAVVVLANGTDRVTVSADGTFSFATAVAAGGSYAVTVAAQPASQVCSVSNGTGAGVTADVTSVTVHCSAGTFSIGGTVARLSAGAQLTLLDNGADPLVITGNGPFTFPAPVAYDGSYAATVSVQPAGQVCSVGNGSGAGVTADVSSLMVTCSAISYSVGGTITGLQSGRQVTLYDNGGDALVVTAGSGASTAFTFAAAVPYQGSYAVTVNTQPEGGVCTVDSATGFGVAIANVGNVGITCSDVTFGIGGSVTGLAAGTQITLLDNGSDAVTVAADGTFTFGTPVAYGSGYAVTVGTQPFNQICTVAGGSGTDVQAAVSDVSVSCAASVPVAMATFEGDGQTVVQHARVVTDFVVKVTDALGNPVGGVAVTFTASTGYGLLHPLAADTFADGTAEPNRTVDPLAPWMLYFHTAGMQQVTASSPGLPDATFQINVTPSPHPYDGVYVVLGNVPMTLSGTIVTFPDSTLYGNGTFDESTGVLTFSKMFNTFQTLYTGVIGIDQQQQATVSGTYVANGGGGTGSWSGSRE